MSDPRYMVLVIVIEDTEEAFEAAASDAEEWTMVKRDVSFDEAQGTADIIAQEHGAL